MNIIARIANSLNDELWHDPLRPFGKKKGSCEIKLSVLCGKIHTLKQTHQLLVGFWKIPLIGLA